MRSIGVVTGGRADYGILLPVLRLIRNDPALELRLYATGMHLADEYGKTVKVIEQDGLPIAERVDLELTSDSPAGVARAMSLAVAGFAKVFEKDRPDLLLVVGDRFEVLAAVSAALPFLIPVAHIAGGDVTEGAIDDAMRHAITKMSHLHFVSAEPHRDRILQLGEEPWRVHVTGEPGLDHLHTLEYLDKAQLEKAVGMRLDPAPLLVTFHPETLDYTNTLRHVEEMLAALAGVERPIVFTAPNADTSGRDVRQAIERFVREHKNARLILSLGTQAYFSLMRIGAAMVGNSSSGIIEAASFGLPVVDIGERQRGRLHGPNVVHARAERPAITAAVEKVLQPKFREGLRGLGNPYGDGHAAPRIVEILKTADLGKLATKRFCDLAPASKTAEGRR